MDAGYDQSGRTHARNWQGIRSLVNVSRKGLAILGILM